MTNANWWPLSELLYHIVFMLIVDMTSANCSHQVQQELSSTFAILRPLSELMYNIVFRLIVDMTSANWWPLSELTYHIMFRLIVDMTNSNWWPLSELLYHIVFRLIIDMTSANCSHQVQQDLCHLAATFRTNVSYCVQADC